MNNMSFTDLMNDFFSELGRLFRFVLPGFVILGGMYGAYYTDICPKVILNSGVHLIVLLIVALVIGNSWYVVHRFTITTFLDYILYCCYEKKIKGYPSWVATRIKESSKLKGENNTVYEHISFRSAQTYHLFAVSETLIFFSFVNKGGTFFYDYRWWSGGLGLVLFIFAVMALRRTYVIDCESVKEKTETK